MYKNLNLKCLLMTVFIASSSFSQQDEVRIIITPTDSVYKWVAETETGIKEFSADKAIVLGFDNTRKVITTVFSVCGSGQCDNGIEINFYPNGLMESKGKYVVATNGGKVGPPAHDGRLDNLVKDEAWFYWNANGILMRKESWIKGRLISTKIYRTIVQTIRPK